MTVDTSEENLERINETIIDFMGWKEHIMSNGVLVVAVGTTECGTGKHIIPLPTRCFQFVNLVWDELAKYDDECEPTVLYIKSPLQGEWLVGRIWQHHDGDIPLSKTVHENLAIAAAIETYKAIESIERD